MFVSKAFSGGIANDWIEGLCLAGLFVSRLPKQTKSRGGEGE